jgi:rare lipoprotein A (peptidoglycan hydrolase)
MKKILSSITTLVLLCSCNINDYENNELMRSHVSDDFEDDFDQSHFRRIRHVKPSESMQAGIPKKDIFAARERRNYYEDVYYADEDGNEAIVYQNDGEVTLREQIVPEGKYRGYYKIGNPYKISGLSYYPQKYNQFQEVGVASWYGPYFHGKETANGEIYDSRAMTAAHRTLPMPSIVRVTNLNNGKSVIVRINDRGPFAKSRIIDVSERAAEILGFKDYGTADVKIELLRDHTDEMLEKLKLRD